jgi:hypothetical protein
MRRGGLRLRKKFGRAGTEGAPARRAAGYQARHAADKEAAAHPWGSIENPSARFIAWLLWGGDEGKEWADRQRRKLG